MGAPTNAAYVKKSPCQLGAVHTWGYSDIANRSPLGACNGETLSLFSTDFGCLNNVLDMGSPTIQCFLALGQKFMPLVDGGHS